MSIITHSEKSRIPIEINGDHFHIQLQNRYTHDGNGNVSKIEVFQYDGSGASTDPKPVIGEFKNGKFILNEKGEKFTANLSSEKINEIKKASKNISKDKEVLDSLAIKTNEQKEKFFDMSGNANQGSNDDGDGDGVAVSEDDINENLKKRQIRERYGNYCYPMTMKDNSQDRIKISVIDFRTPIFNEKDNTFDKGDRAFAFEAQGERTIRGSATLPIPNGVTDFNAVRFGEGTLDPIQVLGAGVALAGIQGGFTGAGDQVKSAIEQGVGDGNTGTAVSNLLTSLALGIQPQQLLARTEGAIFNNNLALLFGGPTLRPFTFNFNVSPRDLKESIEVQKIIRMFKQASAVQRTTNGLFLGSPHVFSIEFIDGNLSTHKFLPRVKDCALLSFSTNYMPNNSYMTYENSSMVSYTLQFQFRELEPIFNDNYDELDFTDFDEPIISDDEGSITFFEQEADSGGIGF